MIMESVKCKVGRCMVEKMKARWTVSSKDGHSSSEVGRYWRWQVAAKTKTIPTLFLWRVMFTSVCQSTARERSSMSVVKDVEVNESAKVPQNIHIPSTCVAVDGRNMTEDGHRWWRNYRTIWFSNFLNHPRKNK